MASSYCPDCGERACNRGVCSNCQEELYIASFQSEYIYEPLSDEFIYEPLSDEFMEKAAEQQRYLNDRGLREERERNGN